MKTTSATNPSVIEVQLWQRSGLMYRSEILWSHCGYVIRTTRKLDFVAYHLIKWYHGIKKLHQMACEVPKRIPKGIIDESN